MAKSPSTNRFASYGADGRLTALVAEGLPAWPEDIASLTDDQLGEMHAAYVEEAATLAADENSDVDRITELTERIPALRVEAAARFAAVQTQLDELAALSEEDLAAVVAYAAGQPTPSADEAEAERRAAALAALNGIDTPPAPDPTPITGESLIAPQVDPAAVAAATATGVTEGIANALAPTLEALGTLAAGLTEAATAQRTPAVPARRVTAAQLAEYNSGGGAPTPPNAPAPRGRLIHTGEAPGYTLGQQFTDMDQLVDAFIKRERDIGQSTGTQDEKVLIASYQANEPSELRDLRGFKNSNNQVELRRRIDKVVGPKAIGVDPFNLGRELPIGMGGIAVEDPEALVASGGLAAPVEPYYAQLLLAEADRPVLAAMPGFTAERGGIRLVLPPSIGTLTSAVQPGAFADGVTNTDTGLVSATADFTSADLNKPVVETDGRGAIPAGTTIITVTNSTTVVLSQATVASDTGVAFSLPARNPNNLGQAVGVVTAAQDAAGPPSTLKYTYDVPLGTQAEHDVYSIYTSLQFANLTARTFPEQVEVNIRLANALAARVADTAALNYITGWSTLLTFAKTFGTSRQLLAQFDHLAAYYRNFNRMDPNMVLRLGIPAWAMNAMRGDYISTFIGGGDNWGLSDEELNQWFEDRSILPFFYWDGPSDISQLFSTVGSGAINTGGTNTATPVAVPDYPGQGASTSFRTKVVSFMWAEGTWLGLTTGELNLGLVRDSILNSQNRFRNFEEVWETPAFVGLQSLRTVHTVAADGTYGAAASVTLGVGSGL